MTKRKKHDGKRIELDVKMFLLGVQRAEKDEKRFYRTQTISERKKVLEKSRFEFKVKDRGERRKIDSEEREGTCEERRAMIDFMRSLINSRC